MASSALDDLVDLLRELRDPSESVLSRTNVARKLFQLVAGLQPLERRELMVEVASRAAPDVAERLTESTGVEVTSEQLTALAEALDQLDPEDVDALVDRLGGPAAPEDGPDEPEQEGPELEAVDVGEPEEPDDELPEPETVETELPADATEEDDAEEPEDEEPEDEEPEDDEPILEPEPAVVASRVDAERSWFTGRPLGIDPVDDQSRMAERIERARGAGAGLRAFRGLLDEIAELPGDGQGEALRAIPDGWARRRALESLVRAGAVARKDIPGLLRTLSGRWPRTWVVGTLLQEDMIDVDQLDELVDPETAGRLRRRVEMMGD